MNRCTWQEWSESERDDPGYSWTHLTAFQMQAHYSMYWIVTHVLWYALYSGAVGKGQTYCIWILVVLAAVYPEESVFVWIMLWGLFVLLADGGIISHSGRFGLYTFDEISLQFRDTSEQLSKYEQAQNKLTNWLHRVRFNFTVRCHVFHLCLLDVCFLLNR